MRQSENGLAIKSRAGRKWMECEIEKVWKDRKDMLTICIQPSRGPSPRKVCQRTESIRRIRNGS